MLDIGYFKALPTEYVLKYVSGKLVKEGPGLAFYYLQHRTQIVAVPANSSDTAFAFQEMTGNFQTVTVQGQCTYRTADPRQAAVVLNFTLEPGKRTYVSEDPVHLAQRVTSVVQMETRAALQRRTLEEALSDSETMAREALARIREGMLLAPMGVELLSLYFLPVEPTPEVSKALEAQYRESLLRRQDEAIYARRAAAVEDERTIKENELTTQVTLEQQREQLIALEGANALQEAELQGRAREREAESRARELELQMAIYRTMQPGMLLALAMKELGQNAGNIGNLTITSELLASVLNALPATAP